MTSSKTYEQKTIDIAGKTYTLQRIPVRNALLMRMAWTRPDGTPDDVLMAEAMLKHVVVSPKLTLDDFDNIMELETVVNKALLFAFYGSNLEAEEKNV